MKYYWFRPAHIWKCSGLNLGPVLPLQADGAPLSAVNFFMANVFLLKWDFKLEGNLAIWVLFLKTAQTNKFRFHAWQQFQTVSKRNSCNRYVTQPLHFNYLLSKYFHFFFLNSPNDTSKKKLNISFLKFARGRMWTQHCFVHCLMLRITQL